MQSYHLTRRNFLQLAALTSGGALLAACTPAQPTASDAAPASEKVTIRWQDWPDWEPGMTQLNALLAEHLPDVTVEFEPLSEGFEDKTLTMMVAGTAPDVMTAWGAIFRKWTEKGQLLDLQPFVDSTFSDEQLQDFHQWQWAGMVAPDTQVRFALPYYVNVIMLLYNKDAFDEAGVAYPTADLDHDSYAQLLGQVTKKEGDETVRWGGSLAAEAYDRFQVHVQAFGGHVVNPDDWTECVLGSPEAQDALEWLRVRLWDENTVAQPLQAESRGGAQMWPTGLLATQEGGMGGLAFYAKESKFNWAMTHLPKGPARRATLGTTDGWAVYKGTPAPDAAWDLMQFLVSDDLQNLMTATWGGIPNRISLFPNWKATVISNFPVTENANLDTVLEALEEGYPMLTEEFKKQAESQQLIDAALQQVFQVGDTPVSVFQEVAQQVTALNREA